MTAPAQFALALLLVAGTAARAAGLDVTVAGDGPLQGTLQIAVLDSADAWDGKRASVAAAKRRATAAQETFHFDGLAPGSYAVRVMLDENDNGKLDTNFIGMPVEPYGISNDPKVMRRPTFDEAKFDLGADGGAITIHLR